MSGPDPNHSEAETLAGRLGQTLLARRGVLTSLAILAGLGLAARGLWSASSGVLRADARYRISRSSVSLDAPPAWLRTDPAAEALAPLLDAGELSILDPPDGLERRLVATLEAEPWVRSVTGIEKAPPNQLRIGLEYRSPLAAIALDGVLTPIDRDAVPLPAAEAPAGLLRRLPRVRTTSAAPAPAFGEPWRDPRIAGAATLVHAFGDAWGRLDLFEVRVDPNPRFRGGQRYAVYELISTGNTRILWGAAPGFEPPSEPAFAEKLAGLESFVARYGPLNNVSTAPGLLEFDIRGGVAAHRRVVLRDVSDRDDGDSASIVK